jgi:MFS family permease
LGAAQPNQKRWLILAVIAATQLMIVVDASIVNIALPHAQAALHISNDSRQWVVTSYTLSSVDFSSWVGGSLTTREMLFLGQLGFAGASARAGLAPNSAVLFTARAVQGAFAALMAPEALALLSRTFTDPKERARASGVYGDIGGGGLAIGLSGGGLLTQFASWRWCLLFNVPIAITQHLPRAVFWSQRHLRASGDATTFPVRSLQRSDW